jgi:arginine repressor
LRDLGVVRIGDLYVLPDWLEVASPFRKVLGLIKEVKPAGPYLTLIVTEPGAGSVVARAIDSSAWDDVVGTVAGTDSVLVLTDGAFDQKLLFARLKSFLEEE